MRSLALVGFVLSVFIQSAFSFDLAPPLRPGSYHSENVGITNVAIAPWAQSYDFKGSIVYTDGKKNYPLPISTIIVPNKKFYSGSGLFFARYGGTVCSFPIKMEVFPGKTKNEIFIRHFSPQTIPGSIQPGKCKPGSGYAWRNEPKPYFWINGTLNNWSFQEMTSFEPSSNDLELVY